MSATTAINLDATVEAIAVLVKVRRATDTQTAWTFVNNAVSRLEAEINAHVRGK